MGDVKILCIIPARSGSKGIQDKNIKLFRGLPLLAWSIEQAEECKYKMRIIVSTDSPEYQKIAIKHGAEAPFLRPTKISGDRAGEGPDEGRHIESTRKGLRMRVPGVCPSMPKRMPLGGRRGGGRGVNFSTFVGQAQAREQSGAIRELHLPTVAKKK